MDPFADVRDGSHTDSDGEPTYELSGLKELARYKALRVPAKHSRPLMFWRENVADFPLMSEVARQVLCTYDKKYLYGCAYQPARHSQKGIFRLLGAQ